MFESERPVGGGFAVESVWQLELPEIRFGVDSVLDLPAQLRHLGVAAGGNGLLITDSKLVELGHADRVLEVLDGEYDVAVYDETVREPRVSDIQSTVDALEDREAEIDFFVGLGGGSALDTAKAARSVLESGGSVSDYVDEPFGPGAPLTGTPVPLVAIPTTGGSPAQISPVVSVRTDDDHKAIISGRQIRPNATIADPTFSVTLPPAVTAATAMDALAPALESYTTIRFDARPRVTEGEARLGPTGRSHVTDTLAECAIRLLVDGVRMVVHNGNDLDARRSVMLGTMYASIAGRGAGVNLAHATGYAIQELYHTNHAVSVGVMAPETIFGYNAASDPGRYANIARLFGAETDGVGTRDAAALGKREFTSYQRDLNAFPSGLVELLDIDGTEDELGVLAERTLEQQRLLEKNPLDVTRDTLVDTFQNALYNWS